MYTENRTYTPMTVGSWLLTFLILSLPIAGFVMQIVWAFSNETHPSKRSFCQASLILLLIGIGIGVLFLVAFGGMALIMGGAHQSSPTLSP